MAVQNGRQVAPSIHGIRQDHVERYRYASKSVENMRVTDAACGVGYGAHLIASCGARFVFAHDISLAAIQYAQEHYRHERVLYSVGDVQNMNFNEAELAVSFETIEHLEDPVPFLIALRRSTMRLICSVPNENLIPYNPARHKYHVRHYTPKQIIDLLYECGWSVERVAYQLGKISSVSDRQEGQTIVLDSS